MDNDMLDALRMIADHEPHGCLPNALDVLDAVTTIKLHSEGLIEYAKNNRRRRVVVQLSSNGWEALLRAESEPSTQLECATINPETGNRGVL